MRIPFWATNMNLEEELICWVTLYLDIYWSELRWYFTATCTTRPCKWPFKIMR